ncbi:MAG: hypothetical protein DMF89_06055 [Acidobacteria bacterium]|nr:MAG: hypothetical protein DMF89_06055 [Acidobacteriota bacterium]
MLHGGLSTLRTSERPHRATRLYVPLIGLEPRCRRCWVSSGAGSLRCATAILNRQNQRALAGSLQTISQLFS